jgi:hypothetical protein
LGQEFLIPEPGFTTGLADLCRKCGSLLPVPGIDPATAAPGLYILEECE